MLLLIACSIQTTPTTISAIPLPTSISVAAPRTSQPSIVPTTTEPPAIPPTLSCAAWQSWPVTPVAGKTVRELYQRGLLNGNDPRVFSKVGDGEIAAEWFFSAFDLGQDDYDLGPYQNLAPAIEHFGGSFGRIGLAARGGFNTERILAPSARDRELCESGESPLTCELRRQRPAFAILSLGTNQVWQPEEFEQGLRQILDILLSKNIVPILSTKGDNLEGDHRINRIIACLAQEYEVPLWNFWSAIQPLPRHGLQPDLEHLTYGIPDFDDERAMQSAWTIRNLTALQALDAVWRGVTTRP
ncbi:MAG TPA: hypothetical protein VLE49_13850 [Anaerolineales bacterium]|nr:hypothetical protein [Anaerolineales bacterium]